MKSPGLRLCDRCRAPFVLPNLVNYTFAVCFFDPLDICDDCIALANKEYWDNKEKSGEEE